VSCLTDKLSRSSSRGMSLIGLTEMATAMLNVRVRGAKRKTYSRIEFFSVLTHLRHGPDSDFFAAQIDH
jgi:hypothetical protein